MGAFLEKPKTDKVTSSGEGYGIRYAVSAMQGWRMEMEDSHICDTDFIKNWSFFGVFDGHAGPKVSQYCSDHILRIMLDDLKASLDECKSTEEPKERIKQAIYDGFLKLDSKIREDPTWANGEDHSGTTAITVMISPTHIYWANCGDSRGFLCSDGKVKFATEDHKPYLAREKERIEKAGGSVIMQRVNGSLAVSRALGDFDYKRNNSIPAKEQLVSPEPEIDILPRDSENDEFLLLACDGIYDVMSNEEVMSYVRRQLELTANLEKICNDLIDLCLNKNSRDNMSVVLVVFPNAPKVSQEAIEKEKILQKEAQEKIEEKLKEMVKAANDPLEVEENYILQQLIQEFPDNYCVPAKKSFISEHLQKLTKDKFGDLPDNFTGQSDSSNAPPDFQSDFKSILTADGNEIHISGVMEEDYPKDENLLQANDNGITEVTDDTPTPDKEEEDEKMETTQDTTTTTDTLPKEDKDEKMEEEGVKTTT